MKRKVYIAALAIIVFLAVGFFYVRSTPHYSLYMLKKAIEKHDPDEALKYIDIDSIVDNLGRNFIGKNEKDGSRKSSLKGMVFDALPGLKGSIRSSIRQAIASGDKSKHKNNPKNTASSKEINENVIGGNSQYAHQNKMSVQLHNNQSLSIGGITIGNIDVRSFEKISLWDLIIQRDEKTAIVSMKDTPNIRVKMIKTDAGYWQITEVLFLP
jgi:hypothetical protein